MRVYCDVFVPYRRLSVFRPSEKNGNSISAHKKGTSSRPGDAADEIIDEGDFVSIKSALSDHEYVW